MRSDQDGIILLDSNMALIFDVQINKLTRVYDMLSGTILRNLNKDDSELPYN